MSSSIKRKKYKLKKVSLGRQESYDVRFYETGIGRKKVNTQFVYFYIKNGRTVSNADAKRIQNLKLPPAWENVWISSNPIASIQAIGQDEQGRKQYKYHDLHIKKAEQEKFLRLYKFIKAIPKLETALKKDITKPTYDKDRVIATMLTFVKELFIRVGKETYVKQNKSYGISSLRKKHIKIKDGIVNLRFKGKSNVRSSYSLKDPIVYNHIKELLKLGGDRVFQYINESDRILPVTDTDLNDYIKVHMGKDFTTKDFRTMAANYLFIKALLNETKKRAPKNDKIIKKNIKNAIDAVAFKLKHTKAISKKSYIATFSMELYKNNKDFFTANKDKDPNTVLLTILKLYKNNVLRL